MKEFTPTYLCNSTELVHFRKRIVVNIEEDNDGHLMTTFINSTVK